MPYPFPSFGGFLFKREETPVYGTDTGWAYTPSYARSRALGTSTDIISTTAIGSADRSFEVYLSNARYDSLFLSLNSRALFTDWKRPKPDSRYAFLSGIEPIEEVASYTPGGITMQKRRYKINLASA